MCFGHIYWSYTSTERTLTHNMAFVFLQCQCVQNLSGAEFGACARRLLPLAVAHLAVIPARVDSITFINLRLSLD